MIWMPRLREITPLVAAEASQRRRVPGVHPRQQKNIEKKTCLNVVNLKSTRVLGNFVESTLFHFNLQWSQLHSRCIKARWTFCIAEVPANEVPAARNVGVAAHVLMVFANGSINKSF